MKRIFVAMLTICFCLCAFTGCTDPGNSVANRNYVYESKGAGGIFSISIWPDGAFTYHEGLFSSYIGRGKWTLDGDILRLEEDAGASLVNHFKVDGNDLLFSAENSSGFLLVDVADGDRFIGRPIASSSGQENGGVDTDYFCGYYGTYIITLMNDGAYSCWNMLYSGASEQGNWTMDGDIVRLARDGKDETSAVNHFRLDGNDLVFMEENSTGFSFMDISDGERIIGRDISSRVADE